MRCASSVTFCASALMRSRTRATSCPGHQIARATRLRLSYCFDTGAGDPGVEGKTVGAAEGASTWFPTSGLVM